MELIVVVGASLAGVHAAQAISRLGFDGDLVVVGAEPHRPYDRPPLSKEYLAGSAADDRIVLRPAAEPDALGATWLLGRRATSLALDRDGGGTVAVDDGSEIPADGIVIATGAVARPLPGQPELDGLTTLRTLDAARRLRHRLASSGPGGGPPSGLLGRLVVVGLGFIGAEVAATARSLGWDVTVIELAESPLSRVLDPEAGASVATLHHDNGVDIRLGTSVAEVEGAEGAVIGVRTDSGEHISCETVLVGIGVLPDTDWLSGSGLAVDDGVLAD